MNPVIVHGVDDVSGLEAPRARIRDVCRRRCHDHPRRQAQKREALGDGGLERQGQDAQSRNEIIGRVNECFELSRVGRALAHLDRNTEREVTAQDVERDSLTHGLRIQVDEQLASVFHRLAVQRQHDIADAQAGGIGGATWPDIRHDHVRRARQAQARGEQRGDGCERHTNLSAVDPAGSANLFEDRPDDVSGRRKPQAFIASGLRHDECVDADQAAVSIDQRTAAAPRVDGRVGLEIDHRIVWSQLPCHGTHDAHGHGVLQSSGTPEGQDQLAHPNVV